jgi:hypothetical protein
VSCFAENLAKLFLFLFVLRCYSNKHEILARKVCRAFLRVSRKEFKKRNEEPEREVVGQAA